LHRASPKVLDQDVARRGEATADLASTLSAEVQRERALVAIDPEVIGAFAIDERGPPGPRFVAAGWLDFDHVGPVVGQHHAAERAGEDAAHVQDAQTTERARHAAQMLQGRATARITSVPIRATNAYSAAIRRSRLSETPCSITPD